MGKGVRKPMRNVQFSTQTELLWQGLKVCYRTDEWRDFPMLDTHLTRTTNVQTNQCKAQHWGTAVTMRAAVLRSTETVISSKILQSLYKAYPPSIPPLPTLSPSLYCTIQHPKKVRFQV